MAVKLGIEGEVFDSLVLFNQSVDVVMPQLRIHLKLEVKRNLEAMKKVREKYLSKYRTLAPFALRKRFYEMNVTTAEVYIEHYGQMILAQLELKLEPVDILEIKEHGIEWFARMYWKRFYPLPVLSPVNEI